MKYIYSIIRFVPDPARGEFVNVGAIVGSEESSEWQVRQVENPARARALDQNSSLNAVWSFINELGARTDDFEKSIHSLFEADTKLSEKWLWDLHWNHQNIVQLSAPTPMVASSADDALERIFNLMILEPAKHQQTFITKHKALATLRGFYNTFSISKGTELHERVTLRTSHHTERFDFAITNGRVVQLAQTWSFQIPDQNALAEQVKAWGWTVQEAQLDGGTISTPEKDLAVPADVNFEVVYIPALPNKPASAFKDAEHVFKQLNISATPHEQARDVAKRARELLGPKANTVLAKQA